MSRTSWAVRVYGSPAPKGSMKCVGGRGRHQLVNNNPATDGWQKTIKGAGEQLGITTPLDGPLGVSITFTVARPASVRPASRPWPHKKASRTADGGGDVDKLARTILDGLQQSRVFWDDAQVCELTTSKTYPDTPGVLDKLDRPGAFIRIYKL